MTSAGKVTRKRVEFFVASRTSSPRVCDRLASTTFFAQSTSADLPCRRRGRIIEGLHPVAKPSANPVSARRAQRRLAEPTPPDVVVDVGTAAPALLILRAGDGVTMALSGTASGEGGLLSCTPAGTGSATSSVGAATGHI